MLQCILDMISTLQYICATTNAHIAISWVNNSIISKLDYSIQLNDNHYVNHINFQDIDYQDDMEMQIAEIKTIFLK